MFDAQDGHFAYSASSCPSLLLAVFRPNGSGLSELNGLAFHIYFTPYPHRDAHIITRLHGHHIQVCPVCPYALHRCRYRCFLRSDQLSGNAKQQFGEQNSLFLTSVLVPIDYFKAGIFKFVVAFLRHDPREYLAVIIKCRLRVRFFQHKLI